MDEFEFSEEFSNSIEVLAMRFIAEMDAAQGKITEDMLLEAVKLRILDKVDSTPDTAPSARRNKRGHDGAAVADEQQPAKRSRPANTNNCTMRAANGEQMEMSFAFGQSSNNNNENEDEVNQHNSEVAIDASPVAMAQANSPEGRVFTQTTLPPSPTDATAGRPRPPRKKPAKHQAYPSAGGKGKAKMSRSSRDVANVSLGWGEDTLGPIRDRFVSELTGLDIPLQKSKNAKKVRLDADDATKYAKFCFSTMIKNFKANMKTILEYVELKKADSRIQDRLGQTPSGVASIENGEGEGPVPVEFQSIAELFRMAIGEDAKSTGVARIHQLILLVQISRAESDLEKLAKEERGKTLAREFLERTGEARRPGDTTAKILKRAAQDSLDLDPMNRSLVPYSGRDALSAIFTELKNIDEGFFGHLAAVAGDISSRSGHLDEVMKAWGVSGSLMPSWVIDPRRANMLPDTDGLSIARKVKATDRTIDNISVEELLGGDWTDDIHVPRDVPGYAMVEELQPEGDEDYGDSGMHSADGSGDEQSDEEMPDWEDGSKD
ncbi:hypothetical protein CSIM01_13835 [Colletotrichum simmondsii]|uniref:Uncharacterized protein n=1 Tax=Colletotrichum simmondsii TaxID=703756 RepID=A0A135RQS2_9PEZI|nr:hypothetical protein CSIM01_13835 [Colletotrichum simmondsii]